MAKFIVNAGEVIDHNGKVYNEGDSIELSAAEAKELAAKVTKGKEVKETPQDLQKDPLTDPLTDPLDDEDEDEDDGDETEDEKGSNEDLETKTLNLVKNYKLDELRAKAAELEIDFKEDATKKDLANLIALKEAA